MIPRPSSQRGFSLIELLISSTLGLILFAAIISIYLTTKQTYNIQDSLARMQENARLALRLITHDARMAGYLGDVVQPWAIRESTGQPLGTLTSECYAGWVRSAVLPADGMTAPTITGADNSPGQFSGCIASGEHIKGTDILAIYYTDANPVADTAIEQGKIYLRSALSGGLLFKAAADQSLPTDFSVTGMPHTFRVHAVAYYLRPWSTILPSRALPAGDGIPTLMRATLSDCGASACVKSEALVEGIVNLQIQYGVDDGSGLGALRYLNAGQLGDFTRLPDKSAWQRVRALRIALLARSLTAEPGFTDSNAPYTLTDQSVTVSAGFRHLLISGTVALRNKGI
jgi:type IV pilus assembly protein PilW